MTNTVRKCDVISICVTGLYDSVSSVKRLTLESFLDKVPWRIVSLMTQSSLMVLFLSVG